MRDPKVTKILTTGQAAKVCNVAPRTVSKWMDSGRLKGYRLPGSKDRRIPRETLIEFMTNHGIPLDEIITGDDSTDVVESRDMKTCVENVLNFARNHNYDTKTLRSDCLAVALSYETLQLSVDKSNI